MGLRDFVSYGLRNKSWNKEPWPHPKKRIMGLWDFVSLGRDFVSSNKHWNKRKPPPPPNVWQPYESVGLLAFYHLSHTAISCTEDYGLPVNVAISNRAHNGQKPRTPLNGIKRSTHMRFYDAAHHHKNLFLPPQ